MKAAAIYVIDYDAKGERATPRMLHRTDCWHAYPGTPFKKATPAELAHLPTCYHCQRQDQED